MNEDAPDTPPPEAPAPDGTPLPTRLAEAAAVGGIGAVAAGALWRGQGESLYCCGDRGCTKVQEHCPAGISRQDELAAGGQKYGHSP